MTYKQPRPDRKPHVNLTYNFDGIEWEGFRPYRGEEDAVNLRNVHGPNRLPLVTAICTSTSPQEISGPYPQNSYHTVWTVIDSKVFTDAFIQFLMQYYPQVTYTRWLRSRT